MTNHKEALTAAIEKAREGLSMWGWDAAASSLIEAGVKVDLHPIDRERFPSLNPYKVELTTRFWNEHGDPVERDVIYGSAYGTSIRDSFADALDDLSLTVTTAGQIVADSEVWP